MLVFGLASIFMSFLELMFYSFRSARHRPGQTWCQTVAEEIRNAIRCTSPTSVPVRASQMFRLICVCLCGSTCLRHLFQDPHHHHHPVPSGSNGFRYTPATPASANGTPFHYPGKNGGINGGGDGTTTSTTSPTKNGGGGRNGGYYSQTHAFLQRNKADSVVGIEEVSNKVYKVH